MTSPGASVFAVVGAVERIGSTSVGSAVGDTEGIAVFGVGAKSTAGAAVVTRGSHDVGNGVGDTITAGDVVLVADEGDSVGAMVVVAVEV